jgi:adenylosuccinate synthase
MDADGASEAALEKAGNNTAIGTTKRGIGPTYSSKTLRIGLRAGDLADWTSFKEKYNYFIERFQYHFPSTKDFNKAAELDQLH